MSVFLDIYKDLYQVHTGNIEVLLSHTHSIVFALVYFEPKKISILPLKT